MDGVLHAAQVLMKGNGDPAASSGWISEPLLGDVDVWCTPQAGMAAHVQ